MTTFPAMLALTASLLALATVVALAVAGLRFGDLPQDPRVKASLYWSWEVDGWVPFAAVALHNSTYSPVVASIDVRPTPRWLGSIRGPLSVSVPWRTQAQRTRSSAETMLVVERGEWAASEVAFAPSRYATVTTTLHQDGGRVRVWKASLPLQAAPYEPEAPTGSLRAA